MERSEGRESCCTAVTEPPPVTMSNVEPERVDQPKLTMMMRPEYGTSGQEITLLANHLKVSIRRPDEIFYLYNVSVSGTYDEKRTVNIKGIGRKIINKLHETYSSEFAGQKFVYDGEKSLYTVGPLPRNRLEFTVVIEESSAKNASESLSDNGNTNHSSKRSKHSLHSKAFLVEIDYAAKIPLRSVSRALSGADPENVQDALRVLDTILRQQAANRGCLLVRQSFFHDDSRNFTDVGGGVMGCRGFHSSFCPTHGGLTLNMDVSTTMILSPGPVIDFLLANQNVKEPRYIDWERAKRMLKKLRVKAKHNNREFKITGLSDKPCNQQLFFMKVKNGGSSDNGEETIEITVYEYFTKHRNIELSSSVYMPCLDVGKPNRPNYLPLELCYLVSLQRYTKALSLIQRTSLVEKSRQKPRERIKVLADAVRDYSYDDDPLLAACGISIEKQLIQFNGRVLEAPKLKVGNGEEVSPCNGRWNFKNKHLFTPARIERWAVVNFSARCDTSQLSRELISCGRSKGIHFERPHTLIEEDPQYRRAGAVVRVEQMFEEIVARLPGHPDFLLCVLPERKNSELYGNVHVSPLPLLSISYTNLYIL
ncbi:Protein argonaute 4A [Capsicum chinense]|nr:Protein argonaute 4A [Capsicum chinense]